MNADWKTATVGDVCRVVPGQSPPGNAYNSSAQGLPFYQGKKEFGSRDIGQPSTWTTTTTKVAEAGDILMSVRAPVGPVNFINERACIGRGLAAIRVSNRIDRQYLFYNLWMRQADIGGKEGAVFASINRAEIEAIRIPLPPLEEQRQIVSVLDEVFAAIAIASANADRNLVSAREISAMFPAADLRSNTHIKIGELLERGWLTGHMDGNHGGDYPRKDEFIGEGVKYLSANCLRDGLVDFSRVKFLSRERAGKLRKGFAKDRDVLFAHNATVGPVALLRTAEDFVVLGTSLTYYRCNEDFILPEYLESYLRSPAFVKQYSLTMRQSTRNQVPITKQREFYVDVPPIDEQRRLVASLSGFQEDGREIGKLYHQKQKALVALKQAILHRAFTGQLTATAPEINAV